MAKTQAKTSPARAKQPAAGKLLSVSTPPLTLEEHLHRIQAVGKRIEGYVQFMCAIASQQGMSMEAKERAIHAFYKQLIIVEKQLGHIHDELKLE